VGVSTVPGREIKRIDAYFGATYQNGTFVRQQQNWTGVME